LKKAWINKRVRHASLAAEKRWIYVRTIPKVSTWRVTVGLPFNTAPGLAAPVVKASLTEAVIAPGPATEKGASIKLL
jgi:hypothetical protein